MLKDQKIVNFISALLISAISHKVKISLLVTIEHANWTTKILLWKISEGNI